MVPEQAKPKTLQGYGAWAIALLLGGVLAIATISALYTTLFRPVERQLTWPEMTAALDAEIAAEIPIPDPLPNPPKSGIVEPQTGLCVWGSSSYVHCMQSAFARADAENDRRLKATLAAQEKVAAREDEIYAATEARSAARTSRMDSAATRTDSFPRRLAARWQFWIGLLLLGGSIAGAVTRDPPKMPEHRDPKGAAVAAIKADHMAEGAPGAIAGATGVALLATLHSFVAFFFIGGAAGLFAWAAATAPRRHRLAAAGYRIADAQWQEAANAAERAGRPAPPEPQLTVDEAQKLGTTGGFTAPEGSAMAVMLDHAGNPGPAVAAWNSIAQALRMGSVDAAGRFAPWAVIEAARGFDDGDVELDFQIKDVTKTAADLTKAAGPLLRELRVRTLVGGAFTTRHTDGRVVGRFSNSSDQAVPAPAAAEVDDDWDF